MEMEMGMVNAIMRKFGWVPLQELAEAQSKRAEDIFSGLAKRESHEDEIARKQTAIARHMQPHNFC